MSNKIFSTTLEAMQKFAANRHIMAVRDGMVLGLAPTLIGSLFLIIRFMPIEAWTNFLNNHVIGVYLLYPVAATMDMVGIIILLGLSYRLAENYGLEPLGAQITALMCYMIITPLQIFVDIPEQAQQMAVAGVPMSAMGTKGLFVALLVGICSVEIYRKVIKDNWVITMPDTVPPAVAKSFMAVVPSLMAILVVLAIRVFFEITPYGTFSVFIEKTLSAPLTNSVNSFMGLITCVLIWAFFMSMGIHSTVTDAIYLPAWTLINDENRIAFQQGLEQMPNIMTSPYINALVNIGGTGATLGLVILSLVMARSSHLKQVSKLAIGPAIFQINEPVIFGMPVVLNPIIMIPFILTPAILATNAYLWIYFGWVPRPTGVVVPWTMPSFFNIYLLSNGSIMGIFLQLVNIIISIICYYPFFKIIDRNYYKNE